MVAIIRASPKEVGHVEIRTSKYRGHFFRALASALWRGFERLDTLLAVIIVLAFTWNVSAPYISRYAAKYLTIEHDPYHPPAWVVASLAALFVVFELYRATLRLYAEERAKREELEQRAIPLLRPDPPLIVEVPTRGRQFKSLRLPVLNAGLTVAHRCSGRIVKIEFVGNRPGTESTLVIMEHAHLTLSWVHRDQQEIDISPQTTEMMEVLCVLENTNELKISTRQNLPFSSNQLSYLGFYKIVIELISDSSTPLTLSLRFEWDFGYRTFRLVDTGKAA
jgi:hypothetical protein